MKKKTAYNICLAVCIVFLAALMAPFFFARESLSHWHYAGLGLTLLLAFFFAYLLAKADES